MRQPTIVAVIAVLGLIAIGGTVAPRQTVYYVDDDAWSGGDGLTWNTAHKCLQDALAAVNYGDEIRVAGGTYTPDKDEAGNVTPGHRAETFQLRSGVALYGGCAGLADLDNPNERDIESYQTILSGDLAGDDGPGLANNAENSYHVLTAYGVGESAVLDGFTITGGNADGPDPDNRGGGLFNNGGSPTIHQCTFRENRARFGGALNNEGAGPIVTDSVFVGNTAGFSGAAMRGWNSSPVVTNCLFVANTGDAGGGMWHGASIVTLNSCTFVANSAAQGNALSFGSCCPEQPSTFYATNCILWDGGDEIWNEDESTIIMTYTDIQDGWEDTGNLDADPQFVPGPAGCYYLSQTASGQPGDSPCLDAGSDTAENLGLDLLTTRSDEQVDTGIVDMGYHHPVTGWPLVMGDFDRNGEIDLADFAPLQNCFTADGPANLSPCCRIFDFEPDDDLDAGDYGAFYLAFISP